MVSIQERLQRKREPLDKWSTREQLCLAFAVSRSGDQNWMSVSRALKPFADANRPSDWFHQKNCAAQYGALLENVEIPKRKKRTSGVEPPIESPSESILRKLISERRVELKRIMEEEKSEYLILQEEMTLLKSGNMSEEQLDQICKQIDDEEQEKEKEAIAHAQWLKERELRKQELERAWRPMKVNSPLPITAQKRKASDSIISLMDTVDAERSVTPTQTPPPPEPSKPALSPLLTSLLKSPSHSQNVTTSSILHSAITSQRLINSNTNPTIASLLNSSASMQVSPGLQQLVTTAISQERVIAKDPITDLLDDNDALPNLKVEDIENTILSRDEPLPEIKNEEVDVIISDLIENADIVTDPEQHLLDGKDDLITDFENELEELVNEEKAAVAAAAAAEAAAKAQAEAAKIIEKPKEVPTIDPFEFQEEELYEPTKLNTGLKQHQVSQPAIVVEPIQEPDPESPELIEEEDIKQEEPDESPKNDTLPGSVEIVEVVVLEDEEINKELDKSQIQDIVHSAPKLEEIKEEEIEETETQILQLKDEDEKSEPIETTSETTSESLDNEIKLEPPEPEPEPEPKDSNETSRRNTFTPEYSEDVFDDDLIEVTKLDKNKAIRDYSRTKKKDETDFDILLAVEQAVNANLEEETESSSEKDEDKTSDIVKTKILNSNDRSNSPWTEEEEVTSIRTRRSYSTATPVDSIPNSPASSTANIEDDRDHRNWKKAIMLVYSRLSAHKYASLFLKPITNEQVPGYHNIVKRAMDLQTIKKNIESGVIRTTVEFQRDVLLMFNNAIMYNKTNDTVYNMASEMQKEGIEQINIFLEAQQNDAPIRRETRTSEAPGSKRKRVTEENTKNKKKKDDS